MTASRVAPMLIDTSQNEPGAEPVLLVGGVYLGGDADGVCRGVGGGPHQGDFGGERVLRLAHREGHRHYPA